MISMHLSQVAEALNTSRQGEDVLFSGCSTDTRNMKQGELFIALQGENFDAHNFIEKAERLGAAAVMVEHIESKSFPAIVVKNTRKSMADLARVWRNEFSIPVIAITGSNGKTTVKEMVASILGQNAEVLATKGNLNNDIGVPLTLFGLAKEHKYAVIEMGANHSGEINDLTSVARPQVAVITQCAPAHLEGFGSIQGIAEAKSEIFSGLMSDGIAVINADDDYADFWRNESKQYKQISFGINKPADVYASDIKQIKNSIATEFILNCSQGKLAIRLNLGGEHNVMNALAAASCVIALGFNLETIRAGLELMQPVKGRLQLKHGLNGSLIIDDSYNANPASLKAAIQVLKSFNKRSCLVIGDMGELGADAVDIHVRAGQEARELGVEQLYAFGLLALETVKGFGDGGRHFSDKNELISTLAEEMSLDMVTLIKGSRAMRMEEVVEALLEKEGEVC